VVGIAELKEDESTKTVKRVKMRHVRCGASNAIVEG